MNVSESRFSETNFFCFLVAFFAFGGVWCAGLVIRTLGLFLMLLYSLVTFAPDRIAREVLFGAGDAEGEKVGDSGDLDMVRRLLVSVPVLVGSAIVLVIALYSAWALLTTPDQASPRWIPPVSTLLANENYGEGEEVNGIGSLSGNADMNSPTMSTKTNERLLSAPDLTLADLSQREANRIWLR